MKSVIWFIVLCAVMCILPLRAISQESNVIVLTPGKAIDLGLSVKWASHNVGASVPEEFGGVYYWGDSTGKAAANTYEAVSLRNISGTKYDIARMMWGGKWRIPTKKEVKELQKKCKWKKVVYKGMQGMLVTGPNGNTIFLPTSFTNMYWYGKRGKCGVCSWYIYGTNGGTGFAEGNPHKLKYPVRPILE